MFPAKNLEETKRPELSIESRSTGSARIRGGLQRLAVDDPHTRLDCYKQKYNVILTQREGTRRISIWNEQWIMSDFGLWLIEAPLNHRILWLTSVWLFFVSWFVTVFLLLFS